jgi:hypothetical protein
MKAGNATGKQDKKMRRVWLCVALVVAAATVQAAGVPQMLRSAPPTNIRLVDFEQLKTFLPAIPGWTQSDTRAEQLTMPAACTRAETRYARDDGHVELEIVDTATSQLLLAPLAMFVTTGFSERTGTGFRRAVRVGGQPGSEDWNASTARGEVTAIVGGRFIVRATSHRVGDIDPVRRIVETVDLAKLATLR